MQTQGHFQFQLHLLGALVVWLGPRGVRKSEVELFSFPALQKGSEQGCEASSYISLSTAALGAVVPEDLLIISLWDVSAHLSSPGPYLGLLTLCHWLQ